jgi:hypothetical protein
MIVAGALARSEITREESCIRRGLSRGESVRDMKTRLGRRSAKRARRTRDGTGVAQRRRHETLFKENLMTRSTMIASAAMALTLTLGAGCDKAADEQQKANAAQTEADRKIAEANREAVTKTTSAQVEADKKVAAAEGDFGKRREDYRHSVQTDLVDLDKKIDILDAKAKTATGKVKTDLDAKLAPIHARRAAFGSSFASIPTLTAPVWDDTKVRLDKEWTDLKAMVDKAQ